SSPTGSSACPKTIISRSATSMRSPPRLPPDSATCPRRRRWASGRRRWPTPIAGPASPTARPRSTARRSAGDGAGDHAARDGRGRLGMDAGLKRALTVLAWLILAVIVFSTLSPIGMRPHLGAAHVERFAAFALLGFLFTTLHPGRIVAVLLCLAAAVAGL